jgi:hypothetical protein
MTRNPNVARIAPITVPTKPAIYRVVLRVEFISHGCHYQAISRFDRLARVFKRNGDITPTVEAAGSAAPNVLVPCHLEQQKTSLGKGNFVSGLALNDGTPTDNGAVLTILNAFHYPFSAVQPGSFQFGRRRPEMGFIYQREKPI